MSKCRFLSIVGARPNFVKLPPIHRALVKSGFEHLIVHTGQHYDYEMSQIFFENLEIPIPNYNLNVSPGNHSYQLGEMIKRCGDVLLKEKPTVVIVYGDTNSTLAGALASTKLGIPIAHIEAGLRSFDQKMPEETNRVLTDHISNELFCPTKTAVENLKRERTCGETFYVGDVMLETLTEFSPFLKKSNVLERLGLEPKKYLLVTIHRAENTENVGRLTKIVNALGKIDRKAVFPIHPRTVKYLKQYGLFEKLSSNTNLVITGPLSYLDFVKLEDNSEKILTDSGGVQKEAYLLGVPCITLRDNTEWVETVNSGWNILVGVDEAKIILAINTFSPCVPQEPLFGNGDASPKITKILLGKYSI